MIFELDHISDFVLGIEEPGMYLWLSEFEVGKVTMVIMGYYN